MKDIPRKEFDSFVIWTIVLIGYLCVLKPIFLTILDILNHKHIFWEANIEIISIGVLLILLGRYLEKAAKKKRGIKASKETL